MAQSKGVKKTSLINSGSFATAISHLFHSFFHNVPKKLIELLDSLGETISHSRLSIAWVSQTQFNVPEVI